MTLRRQSIHHSARDVSFADDGPAVQVALVDAAPAREKERSYAY